MTGKRLGLSALALCLSVSSPCFGETVAPDCPPPKIELVPELGEGKPLFKFYAYVQGTYSTIPGATMSVDVGDRIYRTYVSLRQNLAKKPESSVDDVFGKTSPQDMPQYLASLGVQASPPFTPRDSEILMDFHRLIYAGAESTEKMLSLAKTMEGKYSTEEKLLLSQLFVKAFYAVAYDKVENNSSAFKESKPVSPHDVTKATAANFDAGFYYTKVNPTDPEAPFKAGVCAAFAAAQGQFLKAIGLKNTWVIDYGTISGGHSGVVVADPDHPGRMHSLRGNSRLTIDNREAGEALYQGGTDLSIKYDLADPAGPSKVVVSSTLGNDLKKLAGFHASHFDPLDPNNSFIAQSGVSIGGSSKVGVGFSANTHGQKVVGGTFSHVYGQDGNFPGHFGALVGVAFVPSDFLTQKSKSPDAVYIGYIRFEQDAKTPCLYLGTEKLCGRLEARGLFAVMPFYESKNKVVSAGVESTGGTDLRVQTGVTIDFKSKDDSVKTWLGCEGVIGASDASVSKQLFVAHPFINNCAMIADGKMRVGGVDVLAGSALLYHPGVDVAVGQAKLGFGYGGFTAMGSVQGPLTADAPPIIGGSVPKVGLFVSQKLGTSPVTLFLNTSKYLRSSDEGPPPTFVGGGLTVDY
jgi:hypothetical protein